MDKNNRVGPGLKPTMFRATRVRFGHCPWTDWSKRKARIIYEYNYNTTTLVNMHTKSLVTIKPLQAILFIIY